MKKTNKIQATASSVYCPTLITNKFWTQGKGPQGHRSKLLACLPFEIWVNYRFDWTGGNKLKSINICAMQKSCDDIG